MAGAFTNGQIQAELKRIVPEYVPDAEGTCGVLRGRLTPSVTSAL